MRYITLSFMIMPALRDCLKTMQTMVEGVETLKESIRSLLTRLEDLRRHCDGRKLPDGMKPPIEKFAK